MNGSGANSPNPSDSNAVSDAVAESMAAALRSAGLGDMVEHVEVKPMGYSENVLERVIKQHSISDREGFLTFAHTMDEDGNNYLREEELQNAAREWNLRLSQDQDVEEQQGDEISVDFLLQLGEECSRKNDSKGALTAFNKAIALDPSCDMAWFNRGVLLEAEQDARGARQAFQICLDINPDNAPATANIATLLERIGDDSAAYEMAVRALHFFPGHPLLLDVKQRCAESGENIPLESMPIQSPSQTYDDKQVAEVMKEVGVTNKEAVLAEAVHHDVDENEHLEYQELKAAAEVVAATQEIQQVIEQVEQPVIQEPVVIEPVVIEPVVIEPQPIIDEPMEIPIIIDDLVEQATVLIRSGDAKEALELLSPHLKTIAAEHAGAWRIAGGAMARLELDDHAISALEHAQSLDSSQGSGWFNLGSIYQRKGEGSRAIECYMKAMNVQTNYLKAAVKCSQLCNQTGDIENYLNSTRTLLEIEPNNPAREEFIRILVELAEGEANVLESVQGLPPTLPEGPHLAKEALEYLGYGETEFHARAYTAAKNDVQAVTIWKSMIKNDGLNPETWRGLARSLESAGDLDTAQKCHRKADELSGGAGEIEAISSAPVEQMIVEPVAPQPTVMPVDQQESQADYYMNALGLLTQPEPQDLEMVPTSVEPDTSLLIDSAKSLIEQPQHQQVAVVEEPTQPVFDLAQAAIEAQQLASAPINAEVNSSSVANQDVAWYNQGVGLIESGKFREALSCFDRALPSFAGDDDMIIRILNGRGNSYYYLEEYPKCVEAYHQAMLIRPAEVRGKTLYNMGSAYAEMERYPDAMKCFEQSIPRGLEPEEVKRAKEQIRRCGILLKEVERKNKRR